MAAVSDAVRTAARQGRALKERMARRAVRIPTVDQQVGPPTVYFLTPDFDTPSGGIRVIYQHVDGLNILGVRAAAMHQHPGFRCTWFDNSTVVTDARSATIGPEDVLVVPELCVDIVARMPAPPRHVVLNQSGHLTWQHDPQGIQEHMRRSSSLLGVIAASEFIERYTRYAFPHLPVQRVRNPIDPATFFSTDGPRPKILAYLPRRGRGDVEHVLRLLSARGALHGWRVEALEGLSQHALADRFRQARIVVSTPYQEGFGLPAAEAMACGAYVVGFDGYGGREFMRHPMAGVVPTGDVLALAELLEDALFQDEADGRWCAERGREAAQHMAATYSTEAFLGDLDTAYGALLGVLR